MKKHLFLLFLVTLISEVYSQNVVRIQDTCYSQTFYNYFIINRDLIEYKGKLFYKQNDIRYGDEGWSSDGTSIGTQIFFNGCNYDTSLQFGPKSSHPQQFFTYKGYLYFSAYDTAYYSSKTFLYKSNGVDSTYQIVHLANDGFYYPYLWNDELYSIVDSSIYVFNGDSFDLVLNLPFANCWLRFITQEYYYFTYGQDFYSYSKLTNQLEFLTKSEHEMYIFDTIGNTLFFVSFDSISGYELWKSNGTAATTNEVKNIFSLPIGGFHNPFNSVDFDSFEPNKYTEYKEKRHFEDGGYLYFFARDTITVNGQHKIVNLLHKSDGSAVNTVRVSNIAFITQATNSDSLYVSLELNSGFEEFDNKVFFPTSPASYYDLQDKEIHIIRSNLLVNTEVYPWLVGLKKFNDHIYYFCNGVYEIDKQQGIRKISTIGCNNLQGNTRIELNGELYFFGSAEGGNQIMKINKDPLSISRVENLLSIYPNPFQDNLFVNLTSTKDFSYTLSDLQGRKLSQGKIENNQPIAIGNLAKGIYLISISDNKGNQYSKKIVKD